MTPEAAPILVGYDGSELSKAAVRSGAELFPDRRAVLVTVWEPALAVLPMSPSDPMGMGAMPPDPQTMETFDRAQRESATAIAAEGAALARSLGQAGEPLAVPDDLDVADTLIGLAREQNAAVVVVGSHGISGLRSRLLGTASRKLIEHCDRPVLVIRGD
jgi:nucleotide-binding universal stress UspA family protein